MTNTTQGAIALDRFQDPAIAYGVQDGVPSITRMNEEARAIFDDISSGDLVERIFSEFGAVNSQTNDPPISHISQATPVDIYLNDSSELGPFHAKVIPGEENSGHLLFLDLSRHPKAGNAPSVENVSSVISHDLRNPLDVAKAHLRAAKETGDLAHLDTVENAHERMEQIIRDVLTLTRGHEVVNPSDTVAIDTAAKDAWESVETKQGTLEVTDGLPSVTADRDRVQRLFENLYRNAIEHGVERTQSPNEVTHSTETEKSLTITIGALEDGFYLADDGPGIPSDRQGDVFTPGYSTREGGTGLGLAIVDRIVTAHGWELTLTTAADGGARFEIRFDRES